MAIPIPIPNPPSIVFLAIKLYLLVHSTLSKDVKMFEISAEISFSAAHRLRNYDGPCENVHGHNWLVRATVCCETLNHIGIGIDFKQLRAFLNEITAKLDHHDLNDVFDLEEINPSSENLARYIYNALKPKLAATTCRVSRVDVFETPGNGAGYFEHA
jgi:6-pyruvoyltetrahydropterin/6-carboxytetrahydropterin synthase